MTTPTAVHEALLRVGRDAAQEHACDPMLLQGYLPALLETAGTLRRLTDEERTAAGAPAAPRRSPAWRCRRSSILYMTASRRAVAAAVGPGRRRPGAARAGERARPDRRGRVARGRRRAGRAGRRLRGGAALVLRSEEAAHLRFVEDLLRGQADLGSMIDRAAGYGLNLAAAHVVAVAEAERPLAPAGRPLGWVEQATRSRFPGRGVLVTADAGRLVCAVSTAATALAAEVDGDGTRLAEVAASAASELVPGARWRVAVSRRHAGPLGISHCYAEAVDALDLATRLDLPDRSCTPVSCWSTGCCCGTRAP
jgi:hypothetical protein